MLLNLPVPFVPVVSRCTYSMPRPRSSQSDVVMRSPSFNVLGRVEVPTAGQGSSLWAPASPAAADALGIPQHDCPIEGLLSQDDVLMAASDAKDRAISHLKEHHKRVVVLPLAGTAMPLEARISSLEKQYSSLEKQNKKQQLQIDDQLKQLTLLSRRASKIAMRAMLDQRRERLLGRPLIDMQRGKWWNTHCDSMSDTDLAARANVTTSAELTRAQINLTKYGKGTRQAQGCNAAHQVDREEVAEAVVLGGPVEQGFFRWLYGEDPHTLVMGDEGSDEEGH